MTSFQGSLDMLYTFIVLFGILLFFHFLADYPLQGDFLAKAKNHLTPIPHISWKHALFAHSFIHAGFVYLATGYIIFFVAELVAHFYIDYRKNSGEITFVGDQYAHIACKAVWALGAVLLP